jgi:U-box domain
LSESRTPTLSNLIIKQGTMISYSNNDKDESSSSSSSSSSATTSANGSVVEIPDEFICPITLNIMENPVMVLMMNNQRGRRCYERDAVFSWVEQNGSCPLTRRHVKISDFVPNTSLQLAIRTFRIKHGIFGRDVAVVSDDSDNSDSSMEEDVLLQQSIRPILLLPSIALLHSRNKSRSSRTFTTMRSPGATDNNSDNVADDATLRRARAEHSRRLLSVTLLEAALAEVGTTVL